MLLCMLPALQTDFAILSSFFSFRDSSLSLILFFLKAPWHQNPMSTISIGQNETVTWFEIDTCALCRVDTAADKMCSSTPANQSKNVKYINQ